jgi:N-acetylglutamate synthase-like GNAT family acetyltransferase
LGLSESKGCRVLDVCENDVPGFFERCGFRRYQEGLRFEMTPE